MSKAQLALALSKLPQQNDPRILVGTNTADDAGVIKLSEDRALVHTVDVFAPVVNDPYTFGKIAAINSLSDVWAMGGDPIAGLNVVGFPMNQPPESLGEMLHGGQDAANEAGVAMLGGHTFQDAEIRYGMSVTGEIHPDRIISNAGARPGDKLVITKPLGTGTIIQALMSRGIVSESIYQAAITSMTTPNRKASEIMRNYAHACTDITGFGFIGHCSEMAQGSGYDIEINCANIPTLPKVIELIADGVVDSGVKQNRNSFERLVKSVAENATNTETLLYSSETSGGLVIAVPEKDCNQMCRKLDVAGVENRIIGRILDTGNGMIILK